MGDFILGWIFGYWFTHVEWNRWTKSWKRIKANHQLLKNRPKPTTPLKDRK